MIYNNINQLIGNTPLYNLEKIELKEGLNCKLYAKLEYYNPFMSIKDRPAYNMLKKAIDEKQINSNTVIIEATSGNMGIALAGFGNLFNNKVIIVMPDNVGKERIDLLKVINADVVLVDNQLGYSGCIEKAKELASKIHNSFFVNQFENDFNYLAYQNYCDEIEVEVDCLVVASGTGGSLRGITESLKVKNPNLYVVEVVAKDLNNKIAGITPRIKQPLVDRKLVNEIIEVSNEQALKTMKEIIKFEGLMVGISSGANLYASIDIAKRNKFRNILTVFPDNIMKYLSVL